MSHANEPGRLARGFYLLSAALMASVETSILLQIILFAWPRTLTGGDLTSSFLCFVFFGLNLLGHKIRNYLWANLVGVSVLAVLEFLGSRMPCSLLDYGILLAIVLAGITNAKAMVFLRRLAHPEAI